MREMESQMYNMSTEDKIKLKKKKLDNFFSVKSWSIEKKHQFIY